MHYGFEHVTVTRNGRHAVADITLAVTPGIITAIVGGDGAGKTTLLQCLAGRIGPSSGRVHRAPLRRTGVLMAGPPGYDDLTVAENLRFAASVRKLDRARTLERSAALLAATGLTAAADRLAGRLSGGMRRKLGFALATLHEPDLLLLDEPTTGVDLVSRAELWQLMTIAAASGAAVLLSTTYLDEAERCAEVLALDGGHAVARGAPDTIIAGVRGQLYRAAVAGPRDRSWRRGGEWQVWAPRQPPVNATAIEPDLEDAVIIALLARARGDFERQARSAGRQPA